MLLAVVYLTSLAVMAARSATVPTPSKCCFEKEWTATLGEVGARVTSGHSITTTGSIEMAYDFYRKRVRTKSQMTVNGQPASITLLRDFANRMLYESHTLGPCTMRRMPDYMQMLPTCIPDSAVYLGPATFGYGSETLPSNAWEFKLNSTTVKLAVTQECVPVFEAFLTTRNGTAAEATLFYTNYNPGIDDMSTFDPPTNCALIQDDNSNNNNNNNNGNRPIGR